jgi:hypothetical protein
MVRKGIVTFVKSIMLNGRGCNHTFIITKHPRRTIKGYAHHTERIPEIDDLLGSLASNHEFRSIGSRYYSLLLLAKGNNRGLVDKINDTRHGSDSDKVMVEISILVSSGTHLFTSGYGLVRRKFLSDITINRVGPIILFRSSKGFMVWDFDTETCSIRRIATKVAIHTFESFEMALTGRTAITRHSSNT